MRVDIKYEGFPGDVSGKEPACQCRRHKRLGFNPWVRKIPRRRNWQPTPVFFPGVWRAIVHEVAKESDTTEVT